MKEVPASNEETETLLKSGCMDVNFALRHHAAFYDTKQQRSAVSNSASKKQKSVGSVDEAEGDEDEFISSDQSTQQQQQPVTPVKHVCKPGKLQKQPCLHLACLVEVHWILWQIIMSNFRCFRLEVDGQLFQHGNQQNGFRHE